jgi:hypothetical protein
MTLKRLPSWFGFSISDCRSHFFQSHHIHKNCGIRRILLTFAAIIPFLFGAAKTLHAQTLPPPLSDDQLGLQPFESYHGGAIDAISLSTGTLNIKMPFLTYPQRGKLQLSFDLLYKQSMAAPGRSVPFEA